MGRTEVPISAVYLGEARLAYRDRLIPEVDRLARSVPEVDAAWAFIRARLALRDPLQADVIRFFGTPPVPAADLVFLAPVSAWDGWLLTPSDRAHLFVFPDLADAAGEYYSDTRTIYLSMSALIPASLASVTLLHECMHAWIDLDPTQEEDLLWREEHRVRQLDYRAAKARWPALASAAGSDVAQRAVERLVSAGQPFGTWTADEDVIDEQLLVNAFGPIQSRDDQAARRLLAGRLCVCRYLETHRPDDALIQLAVTANRMTTHSSDESS